MMLNLFFIRDNSEQFELYFCCLLGNITLYFFLAGLFIFFVDFIRIFTNSFFISYLVTFLFDFVKQTIKNNVGFLKFFNWGAYSLFYYILFFNILFFNICGMLPFTYVITSLLVIPFFFSFVNYIYTFILSLRLYKLFIFGGFLPENTDIFITPLLIPIEIISYFVKLLSLAIRLFANLFAGHVLVKVLLSLIFVLYLNYIFIITVSAAALCILIIGILFLELFICSLQAYVFLNLATIYLTQAISFLHH